MYLKYDAISKWFSKVPALINMIFKEGGMIWNFRVFHTISDQKAQYITSRPIWTSLTKENTRHPNQNSNLLPFVLFSTEIRWTLNVLPRYKPGLVEIDNQTFLNKPSNPKTPPIKYFISPRNRFYHVFRFVRVYRVVFFVSIF